MSDRAPGGPYGHRRWLHGRTPRRRRRVPPQPESRLEGRFLILGAVVFLFALTLTPLWRTDVSLEALSSSVSFTSVETAPLLAPFHEVPIASVRVSGLAWVVVPDDSGLRKRHPASVFVVESVPARRVLSTDGDQETASTEPSAMPPRLDLGTPIVPPDHRVHVSTRPDAAGWVLEIVPVPDRPAAAVLDSVVPGGMPECGGDEFRVSFLGRVEYAGFGDTAEPFAESVTAGHPQPITLCPAPAEILRMEVATTPSVSPVLAWQLEIRDLSFEAVEELETSSGDSVTRVYSGLSSGVLSFDDVPHREHEIRRGEHLRIEGAEGTLQSLELEDGQLRVNYAGVVGDIARVGSRSRTLMPAWIDWAVVRPIYRVILGVLISVVLVGMGLRNFWGVET